MKTVGIDRPNTQNRLSLLELVWISILGIFIIFPDALIPFEWQPLVVMSLLLFWPIRWIRWCRSADSRQWIPAHSLIMPPVTPISIAMLILLIAGFIGLVFSPLPPISWTALGYLLFGIASYAALVNYPLVQNNPIIIAQVIIVGGVAFSAMAPFITEWKSQLRIFHLIIYEWLETMPIRPAETIHSNLLAGYLVIAIPLCLNLALTPKSTETIPQPWYYRVPRLPYMLSTLIMTAVLVLTQSRGAYAALISACFVLILLRFQRMIPFAVVTLVIFGSLASLLTGDSILTSLLAETGETGTMGGWFGRIDIWTQSLLALQDFPFTGIGIGTFQNTLPLMYYLRVDISSFPHAHNLLLQIGLDTGILGMTAYMSILLINMSIGFKSASRTKVSFLRFSTVSIGNFAKSDKDVSRHGYHLLAPLASGAVASLVGLTVHGLVDAVVWGNRIAILPWLLFAIINSVYLTDYSWPTNPHVDS